MKGRWGDLVKRYPTLAKVSTLMTGTVLAQVLVFALAPISSRVYTPEQTGEFAIILAVATTIATVAGLRYDLAIVLEENPANARMLRNTVSLIITLVAVIATITLWIAGDWLAKAVNHPQLGPWFATAGLIIFTTGQINSYNYWFTKTDQFRAISVNRVQMRGSIEAIQILLSLFWIGGLAGLVVGHILGQAGAAGTLAYKGKKHVPNEGSPTVSRKFLLKRYRRMPLINGPNALVDQIRLQGINLLIGTLFSTNAVGQFSKAWLLMQAPVTLVTGAVSQVFFQRFAQTPRGEVEALVKRSVKVSAAIGFLPFLLLLAFAPVIFPWYLGSQWDISGYIAQALVPWLFLNVATSPISTVFIVTERQHELFIFAVVYMATGLGSIYWGHHAGWTILQTTWLLSGLMAVCLAVMILLTIRAGRIYDKSEDTQL
ncbi:MAG: oligosaccharide flippase family protein [Trueperella sp.]|nr:oligosaccharide flippase family protein [Trueperella sp.]